MIDAGHISIDEDVLRAFCQKWQIAELALFGSVLRDDFGPDSDVDVLVTFEPNDPWRLRDLRTMQDELEGIFGREVDMVERKAVEQNPNWITRKEILSSARVLHVA